MKFTNILHALHCEPWLITPQMHATLCDFMENHIAGVPTSGPLADLMKASTPKMEIKDGVAEIPVEGVIGRKLSAIEKSCGAMGVEDIEENLKAALEDPNVSHILLNIDSPGGSVGGVPELGAMVASAAKIKPVMAYVDGLMASAAYWIGAGASQIYGSESSVAGSIGVYVAVLDQSRRAEMAGVKVEVVKAGKFKGAGYPGTTMNDEQKAQVQAQVNQIKDMFDCHVSAHRGQIDMPKTAQGQVFIGKEAVACGLIDCIASKSEAIAALLRM